MLKMFSMKTSPLVQVYLVAGGWTGSSTLASTELLVEGASSWTKAAPLPRALQGLDIVSINNQVILTGESSTILTIPLLLLSHLITITGDPDADASGTNYYQTAVLQLDPTTLSWRRVGELQQARTWHRTGVIRMERLQQNLCGVKTPPTATATTTATTTTPCT